MIQAVLGRLSEAGVRLAEPGEFTRRAFEAAKLDLAQAEAVADLVDAETRAQARQALAQLDGQLSGRQAGWREALVEIRARLEALVDFPDEDIDAGVDRARKRIKDLAADLDDGRRRTGPRRRQSARAVAWRSSARPTPARALSSTLSPAATRPSSPRSPGPRATSSRFRGARRLSSAACRHGRSARDRRCLSNAKASPARAPGRPRPTCDFGWSTARRRRAGRQGCDLLRARRSVPPQQGRPTRGHSRCGRRGAGLRPGRAGEIAA